MEKESVGIIREALTVATGHRLLATMEAGHEFMVTIQAGHELLVTTEVEHELIARVVVWYEVSIVDKVEVVRKRAVAVEVEREDQVIYIITDINVTW